jgi:translation initiation factor 4G
MGGVQGQQGGRSPSQPFIHSTPPRSKAIPIINPETMAQVKTEASSSASSSPSNKDASPVIPKAEEKKEKVEIKPAGSPSRAIKIVDPAIREREEREKREKEDADKKAKEDAERKAQEEKEREAQEAKKRAEQEEAERVERERLADEERQAAEKKAREEEEQRLEEERLTREREEKERQEKEEAAKKAEEEARLQKESEEAAAAAAAAADTAAAAAAAAAAQKAEEEQAAATKKAAEEAEAVAEAEATKMAAAEVEATAKAAEAEAATAAAAEKQQETDKKEEEERIAAIAAAKSSRGPGRLDLTAIPPHVAEAMPTPVATVEPPKSKVPSLISRTIDPSQISYPEGVQAPAESKPGVQQYDVAFLMQFALLCSDTAEDLSAFENVGIDDQNDRGSRPGMQRRQTSERGRGPRTPGSPMGKDGKFEMGKFAGGRSLAPRQGSGSHALPAPGSPGGMQRDGSHGGRSRSGRGGKGRHPPREQPGGPTIPLDQVVPLEKSENRWVPVILSETDRAAAALESEIIPEEIVIRKVKSLLNKLTLEKFDSIAGQILEYANQSAKETDGKTLRVVIQLVFEKATDESQFAQMWAQLCRKMLDNMSSEIRDENVKDNKGQYVTGSNLFRKYLLNRCQEDFERGWKGKLPEMPDADSGVLSEEYYAAVKAKRQGLGLIRLIGELFKLQMLTERIMHECIKKLLSNVSDPEEEETESLCKLMTTVGKDLDHPKAKGWMDIYFERIKELQQNPKLSSRIRFMIQVSGQKGILGRMCVRRCVQCTYIFTAE